VFTAWKKVQLYPAGLEKLIPISVSQAAKEQSELRLNMAWTPAGLFPMEEKRNGKCC
jgi:hypothetical protein